MADLTTTFLGIKSPNPFWLASAPPTDKAYNVNRAFEAGWGGVVWKTLGEDPPIVNVNGPRYGAIHGNDRRVIGFNNIELITDRPLATNLQEIRRDQARLAGSRADRIRHAADERAELGEVRAHDRRHRCGRARTQLRLPARHERTRHGLGRGPGARVHPAGRRVVQEVCARAGDREAHAQHHQHPARGQGRKGRRRRRRLADQYAELDHARRLRRVDYLPGDGRQGFARRLLRTRGEAHRPAHGCGDRTLARDTRPAHLRYRRHHRLARCRRLPGAGSNHGAGMHRRDGLRIQDHRRPGGWFGQLPRQERVLPRCASSSARRCPA